MLNFSLLPIAVKNSLSLPILCVSLILSQILYLSMQIQLVSHVVCKLVLEYAINRVICKKVGDVRGEGEKFLGYRIKGDSLILSKENLLSRY